MPKSRAATQERELISIRDAAAYASVSVDTIRRRIADGTLTAYRMGPRLIRVKVADVDVMLHRIPTGGVCA